MKVEIIDGCIGCGQCTSLCPNVFELNDQGFASVINNPDSEDIDSVKEAAGSCPVQVIIIDE